MQVYGSLALLPVQIVSALCKPLVTLFFKLLRFMEYRYPQRVRAGFQQLLHRHL